MKARSLWITSTTTAAALALRWLQQQRRKRTLDNLMSELEKQMIISKDILEDISADFMKQMEAGLTPNTKSTILMLPSMVDFLPSGHEVGQFLAIDIGGSNFRVLYSRLSSEKGAVEEIQMEECSIPDSCRRCSATHLFDFMAGAVVNFVNKIGIDFGGVRPTVGFCFSFPVAQNNVHSGTVIKWTKGFEISGSEGVDLVKLLEESFDRQGLPVRCTVLINDTVATLCAARYSEPDATIGLILGTGVNACYVENIDRVKTIPSGYTRRDGASEMIVNTEFGGYGSPVLPRMDEDVWLDCASPLPGEEHLEKMLSGLYMGEIARRILLRLAEEGDLFNGIVPQRLLHGYYTFTSPQMSAVDADTSPTLDKTADTMCKVFGVQPDSLSIKSRKVIQRVCQLVAIRSARLLAMAISSILRFTGRDDMSAPPRTVLSVDGGVYEKYANYRLALDDALKELLTEKVASKVEIWLTSDGSSLGAAHLAAAALDHMTT